MARTHELVLVGRVAWGERPRGVVVLDDVTDADLSTLYAHATGVVSPSLYEGFGLPLVEAMRAGTPLACSDIPVFQEVSGGHASFFDPLSEEAIGDALLELVGGARPGAVDAARERADGLTWTAARDRLLDLYREVAA